MCNDDFVFWTVNLISLSFCWREQDHNGPIDLDHSSFIYLFLRV